jgi:hypothetical protein
LTYNKGLAWKLDMIEPASANPDAPRGSLRGTLSAAADPTLALLGTLRATSTEDGRTIVAQINHGEFSVSLPVGSYAISATSAKNEPLPCDQRQVTIQKGRTETIEFACPSA